LTFSLCREGAINLIPVLDGEEVLIKANVCKAGKWVPANVRTRETGSGRLVTREVMSDGTVIEGRIP